MGNNQSISYKTRFLQKLSGTQEKQDIQIKEKEQQFLQLQQLELQQPQQLQLQQQQQHQLQSIDEKNKAIARNFGKKLPSERLPLEIWLLIFSYFYPSELAKATAVCKDFYRLIFNLNIWLTIKKKAFFRDQLVNYLLPNIPHFTSYALYTLAHSYRICEQCFRKCEGAHDKRAYIFESDLYEDLIRGRDMGISNMPLSITVPWTTSKIRFCRRCRREHYELYPESIPREFKGKRLRCKEISQRLHLRRSEVLHLKRYGCGSAATTRFCAEEALMLAREIYGGDVGIVGVGEPIQELLDRSAARVSIYGLRLSVLKNGGTWRQIAP